MRVIISGGGTGGHIFPAITIADKLKEMEPSANILFVGAKGKMEMEIVPKAGYLIEGLWISGFQRKLTIRNLLFPFKLLSSLIKARAILKRFKPDVVVGVGGYASGPILEMATRLGIKSLVQEQNSYPGITNRLLAKKVNCICVAYDGMEKYFPEEKLVLTGNPMRALLKKNDLTRKEALAHFGLVANKKTLLLFGGSLGAKSLNEAVAENIEILKEQDDLQFIWQVGKGYYEEFKTLNKGVDHIRILSFIDRMDMAYELADLAITRAGALTVSELALVGQAAILIPSPNVAEDHQSKNAKALFDRNAAIIIEDVKAKELMISTGLKLIGDNKKLSVLSNNIKKMAKPDAAELVVKEVMNLYNDGY